MEYYFIFIVIASLIFRFKTNVGYFFAICISVIALFLLPTTGMDYDVYKASYDSAVATDEFPWFKSTFVELDAEPFYVWYTSFISTITHLPFNAFLSINLFLCVLFFAYFSSKLGVVKDVKYIYWGYTLPVILPTLFYFSPRSSVPFVLLSLMVFALAKRKYILGLVLGFIGISFHSQYLLLVSLLLYTTLLLFFLRKEKGFYVIIATTSVVLFFILRFLPNILNTTSLNFSFLPSSTLIMGKLSVYFGEDVAGNSIRFSSILSCFVFPMFSILLLRKRSRISIFKYNGDSTDRLLFLCFALSIYGAIINLAYWGNPHVAGRLSRLSDYIGFTLLLPLFLKSHFKTDLRSLVLLLLCLIAPIVYPTIYQ